MNDNPAVKGAAAREKLREKLRAALEQMARAEQARDAAHAATSGAGSETEGRGTSDGHSAPSGQ